MASTINQTWNLGLQVDNREATTVSLNALESRRHEVGLQNRGDYGYSPLRTAQLERAHRVVPARSLAGILVGIIFIALGVYVLAFGGGLLLAALLLVAGGGLIASAVGFVMLIWRDRADHVSSMGRGLMVEFTSNTFSSIRTL